MTHMALNCKHWLSPGGNPIPVPIWSAGYLRLIMLYKGGQKSGKILSVSSPRLGDYFFSWSKVVWIWDPSRAATKNICFEGGLEKAEDMFTKTEEDRN